MIDEAKRARLIDLLRELSFERRRVVLASGRESDFEELALTDFGNGGEPEAIERRAYCLALRIEDGGLRSYENASVHGEL